MERTKVDGVINIAPVVTPMTVVDVVVSVRIAALGPWHNRHHDAGAPAHLGLGGRRGPRPFMGPPCDRLVP